MLGFLVINCEYSSNRLLERPVRSIIHSVAITGLSTGMPIPKFVLHDCSLNRLCNSVLLVVGGEVDVGATAALAIGRWLALPQLTHQCTVSPRSTGGWVGGVVGWVGLVPSAGVVPISLVTRLASNDLGDQSCHDEFNVQLRDICEGGELHITIDQLASSTS